MITADTLKSLTGLTAESLGKITGETYTGTKFLGLTNGGEFCYLSTFMVKGGTDSAKVFIKYDPTTGQVIPSRG